MKTEPQKEHQWLEQLLGEWIYEFNEGAGEDGKPVKLEGKDTCRAIGDLWVQAESVGAGPFGSTSMSQITLGWDPAKQKFVGTFLASPMAYLWVYEGDLDPSGRSISLYSDGPSMKGDGSMEPYKDVIEFVTSDHRTLTGHTRDADGSWKPMMKVDYRRVK